MKLKISVAINIILSIVIVILLVVLLKGKNDVSNDAVGIYQYTFNNKTYTLKLNADKTCTIYDRQCKWDINQDNITIYTTYYGNKDDEIHNYDKSECDYYVNLWAKDKSECVAKTRETKAILTDNGILIDNDNYIKIKGGK